MKQLSTILTVLFFSCASAQSPELVWVKAFAAGGPSVAIDANGNVYTAGVFSGTVDFDPGIDVYNLTAAGIFDIFISKLDASGNFVWAKAMGGPGHNDGASSIALDAAGNVYVTGSFQSTADFDPAVGKYNLLTSAGSMDIFVCKLNAAGNLLWARQMGGEAVDYGTSITVDVLGNVFTTGNFFATADFDPGPGIYNLTGNGMNAFISKLDASGNFLWAKQLGKLGGTMGAAIKVDKSGNVYTTGSFDIADDFDPGPATYNLSTFGDKDIFISKLDASGNFLWAKSMGGGGEDMGSAITLNDAGDVYTTGRFYLAADFDPGPGTYSPDTLWAQNVFISKLDASGNFVWAKVMGQWGINAGYSIATDASGNVYTTGFFRGTVDFDPGPDTLLLTAGYSNTDVFISKLDSSGNYLFAGNMGRSASGEAKGLSIALDALGNMYISGYFIGYVNFGLSPDKDLNLGGGRGAAFVVRLNQVPYCTTYYRDVDGDGFGNAHDSLSSCTPPPGYTTNHTDCNDDDNTIHAPGTYYRDLDLDGLGDPDHPICACSNTPPAGYVNNRIDCNDAGARSSDTMATVTVPGTSNSWLAGMPDGTQAQYGDDAPANSPVLADVKLTRGCWIQISRATGAVSNEQNSTFGPEGCRSEGQCNISLISHLIGAEHGKSGLTAPINSLIAVFLNDQVPKNPVPQALDFSTQSSRNYLNLYPRLQQVFFIGNGKTDQGAEQKVFIPEGATRLYLGTMDGNEWNNNIGSFCVTVKVLGKSHVDTWYEDADGDGYGDPEIRVNASTQPAGYVADNTDCNDNNNAIHRPVTYYRDLDRDGYGDSFNSLKFCSNIPPPGYVTNNYDCYDSGTISHPEYVRVRMCHDGWTQCVNASEISAKLALGWTMGPCSLQTCAADETLLCHNGRQVCVKTTDVPKYLAMSGWWAGPYCSGTAISRTGVDIASKLARPGIETAPTGRFRIYNYPNPFCGNNYDQL
jgi:hypothetical protein